ncbi:hypothetical protein [Pseudobutyrivibrio sp.]
MGKTFEEASLDIINAYFKAKEHAFKKHIEGLGWKAIFNKNYWVWNIVYKSSGLYVSEVEVNGAYKLFDECFPTFEEWLAIQLQDNSDEQV